MKERTNEELNAVIARWRGWRFIPSHDMYISGQVQAVPEEWEHDDHGRASSPPDYCSDANAIDAEVRRLDFNDQCSVCEEIVRRGNEEPCYTTRSMATCFALPRDKAEVLVKVIEEGRR